MNTEYKHWQMQIDDDSVIWLALDKQDEAVNTINPDVLDELEHIISEAEQNHSLKGVIIYSAKKSGFVAGADVKLFHDEASPESIDHFIRRGQEVFAKLEALPVPTLALIHGFCMGGGMELALACRYRLAMSDVKTTVGLPEIKLGILPAWGGTVRMPKTIGFVNALPLIMAGKVLPAKKACKLGLIDKCVAERHSKAAAKDYILNPRPRARAPKWQTWINQPFMRTIIGRYFASQLKKRVNKRHYPAPFHVLNNWIKYGARGQKAFEAEVSSVNALIQTDTAQSLIRVFFLQTQLKGLARAKDFPVKYVHVIGSGTMGGDIAAWCALRGFVVTVQDQEPKYISPAILRAHKLFKKKLHDPLQEQAAMDRLIPDTQGHGIKRADVVIEAIVENVNVKRAVFKTIEPQLKPGAIIASNTSTIPLDEMSSELTNPERLVGIHFFNPVALMPLVEIVKSDKTDENVVKKAMSFVRQIDKLPLPVKSSPGFLVNRILMPYMMEAMTLFEEGVPASKIDKAAVAFGMPMGPLELSDTVGLDVCLMGSESLSQYFDFKIPDKLREYVDKGWLGKKTKKGIYDYRKGKPIKLTSNKRSPYDQTAIQNRLILRMMNEAAACLDDKIVESADLLDAAMVFGTGFAPFRGGLMHYSQTLNKDQLKDKFEQLEQQYGDRFKFNETITTNGN